jgi:hypothetical protein
MPSKLCPRCLPYPGTWRQKGVCARRRFGVTDDAYRAITGHWLTKIASGMTVVCSVSDPARKCALADPAVRALASPAARARSRISNRKVILPELNDGRSAPARRYRDLVNAYIADMGVRRTYPPIKI